MSEMEELASITAEQVRADNADLDQRLLAVCRTADASLLIERDDAESWSAAQVMAHLTEFPRFFATELRRLFDDPEAPVGRTVEHDDRLAAVAGATSRSLDELIAGIEAAFTDLADALRELDDDHLHGMTQNRKYGAEPMTAFLDRYVIGHKRGHLDQLANKTPAGRAAAAR